MRTVRCYICSAQSRPGVKQGGYSYFTCEQCRSSQLDPVPTDDEVQEFYDRYHSSPEQGGSYAEFEWRMQADFPFKVGLVLKFAASATSDSRIRLLDVGCGKGYFLKEAGLAGVEGAGIDLSRSAVKSARELLDVDARAGRIEKDAPREWHSAFDIATFWASIEHLRDPLPVLDAIERCLKPGGVLLCDTGLGAAPWEGGLAGYSQWYDAPEHIFVFSRQGLLSLLNRAGFEVIRVDDNSERNLIRRVVRYVRHAAICQTSSCFRPLLGPAGFKAMQQTAKWPIGRVLLVAARKRRGE